MLRIQQKEDLSESREKPREILSFFTSRAFTGYFLCNFLFDREENSTIIELHEEFVLEFQKRLQNPSRFSYTRYRIFFTFHLFTRTRLSGRNKNCLQCISNTLHRIHTFEQKIQYWITHANLSEILTDNFIGFSLILWYLWYTYSKQYTQVHRPRRAKLLAADIVWKRKLEADVASTWFSRR